MKTFHIYRSSAGSGKTRTLAKEYLKLALRHRADYFKHILAVTFTNKATQEMKDRILVYLDDFAKGKSNELAGELKAELKLDENTFRQYSQEALSEILHKYDQFSISTIDAFFQKVIRSFTRESGLVGDYRLEVEQDAVLEEVVDNLIDELGNNKELTDWVVEFARENLENEKAWDVRNSLIEFSREIFREEFKVIEEEVNTVTAEKGFFKNLRDSLWTKKNFFISKTSKEAREALQIIEQNGWIASDFNYGQSSGIFTFFETFANEKNLTKFKPPGDRMRNLFSKAENWAGKKTPHAKRINQVAEEKLLPIAEGLIAVYDTYFGAALSAEVVLKNMYVFGLITDISRKLKEYKTENQLMLLADAPKFLNGVIQDSDTPFIYEKVGSFYRNYLIDEFQDTSGLQWKNFLPLLVNGLDQGYPSFVVGDVKQAIYRWRGGDLKLLQEQIEGHIGSERVEVKELDQNFRSSYQVVNFNNALFQSASSIVALETGMSISEEAYKDVGQKFSKEEDGFVQVKFIQEEGTETKWKDLALERVPEYMEQLQEKGVTLKDIAILVRKNDEGQKIATYLLQYRNSEKAKPHCRYDVVSNESLRIDGAASVNLLVGALQYLFNPDDAIARARLSYEFAKLHEPDRLLTEVFSVTNQLFFEGNLPPAFAREKLSLKKLPLFELTETLIEIFKLGALQGELTYLQAFQDLVLDFYSRERNDLGAFLEWWEENRNKKSILVSGEVDAAQIITIHKSKGLQFRYVIIPFCSWGLDHDAWQAPNLWVKSSDEPFSLAGYVPVKYSSALSKTFFDSYYEEERTRCYLDNLNLLYVALTRAEHGLIVTAPRAKGTVAALLHQSIQSNEVLKKFWSERNQELKAGEWSFSAIKTTEFSTEALSLLHYPSSRWRDKLVIRQSGASYFEEVEDVQRQKINYGIQIHTVLSRIQYSDEINSTLEQVIIDGFMTHEEKQPIQDQLEQLLGDVQIADWFARKWDVRTEVPILLPGGEESRIDRLLIQDKKAIVIDFKTGEKKKTDQQQVLRYIDILKQMNFLPVEGFLLYIKDGEVVEVKAGGKQKTVKKKDENQLGLGF